MIRAMQGAAQDDGALSLINPAEWDAFALELVESAPGIMRDAFQVLATQAQRNRFAIMIAAAGTAGALAASEPAAEVAHKFFFGNGMFGGEKSGDNNDGDDEPSKTSKSESSSTSMCDPSGTVDENSVRIRVAYNDSLLA